MESLFNFEVNALVQTIGYIGLFAIVFVESGLLIGFFLPGDTLLFAAGLAAAQGFFSLPLIVAGIVVAAIAGDQVGYFFGKHAGPKIFKREDSFWFHRKHIERAERFYEEHGKKTIIIARFIPIVRTFAPIVAGVGRMNYRTFVIYNIAGGLLWGAGLTLLGYFLGRTVSDIDNYLLPIIGLILVISFIPVFKEVYAGWKRKRVVVPLSETEKMQ